MTCITNMPRAHRLGISAGGAKDANPNLTIVRQLAFISNSHVWTPSFAVDTGHRGDPWEASEGAVYDKGSGSGAIVLIPRAEELRTILPLLIGGSFSTNILEPAAICDFFRIEADKKIQTHNHLDCKTASWTFASSAGSPLLQLDWSIESCRFATASAGTFTSGLSLSTQQPFVHSSATITINSVTYRADAVQIAGNNNLSTDIFYNSPTRTDLAMGNQAFTLTTTLPYDAAGDLNIQTLGQAATHVSAQIVYTSGNLSLTIDFPALHAPVPTPISPAGQTATRYEGIQWTARSKVVSGSVVKPIKFTLDDTP